MSVMTRAGCSGVLMDSCTRLRYGKGESCLQVIARGVEVLPCDTCIELQERIEYRKWVREERDRVEAAKTANAESSDDAANS